jgi:hypothetical protein
VCVPVFLNSDVLNSPLVLTESNQKERSQLALADFFLFSRLKSIVNGARFADVAAIQERVTAVLRSIHKEAFPDSFHNPQKATLGIRT